MVSRAALPLAVVLGLGLATAPARADSPHLADARRAVEAVDYDAARRLLVEALRDGGNSPAAMREIYRLSARAAVVLGQRDLAEQYYRCWLAIDPDAALPGDTAPKLREPFVAAQAYIAAHGRLRATAQRTATGEIDVELVADPLAMAYAAASVTRPSPVVFDAARRARLAGADRIAILDERGNHLLELEPAAPADPAAAVLTPSAAPAVPTAPESPADQDRPPWTRRWLTWAIPTGVFALGAAGFGIASIASYGRAHEIVADSSKSYLSDAQDNVRRGRIFAWITAGAGAAAIGCAIPMAIYLSRDIRDRRLIAIPTIGSDHAGLALGGRF